MAMIASPGTGTPNIVPCPVFVSMLASRWAPKRSPHMLSSVPEGDIASEAQPPALIGPMSLVVILLPFTSMAHNATAGVEEEVGHVPEGSVRATAISEAR